MRKRQTGSLNQVFFSFAGLLAFLLMVSLACNIPTSKSIQTGSGEEMTSSVGTEGGIVIGPGEVELVVPEGAFTQPTEIRIEEIATAPRLPEDADINIAGKPVEITFSTQAEADAVFELVLPLEREGGVPDDQYSVLRWDGARWTTAGGFVEGDHIRVWTNRFSIFMPARAAWANRPVSFVNNGPYNAIVMPWTFQPFDPSVDEDIPPGFSTVSTAPGGPGLWPNPSRFLSLPLGIYTFCIEWDEDQDLDNDGYIDVYHFILEGSSADLPLHVDENDSLEIAFAEEVQFRTDPIEKLAGGCGSPDVASGSPDADSPTETIEVNPIAVSDYPHTYIGELKLITTLGTCTRIDYLIDQQPTITTEVNEVILIVDEDGTINGEMNTRQTAEGHTEGVTNAEEYIGDCEGELTGTQGNLTCTLTQQWFLYCSDCGPPEYPKNHFEASFEVHISDNNMIGTRSDDRSSDTPVTEDCFSFEVSK